MKSKDLKRYIAFLRGINVGGHHKVPMADLKQELGKLGFENIITILNSGNVIFDSTNQNSADLENIIATNLENKFGFPIPTIIRESESILKLHKEAPFQKINITKDIRLYISFLKNDTTLELKLPWASPDKSYKILRIKDKAILSVLDLSVSGTPKAMEGLGKAFGKDITTRNWKTIDRIVKKL